MRYGTTILVSVALFLCCKSLAQEDKAKEDDEKKRLLYIERIGRVQQEEDEAIQLLKDATPLEKRPKAVLYAIKFLGSIRSNRAVPVLCDRLLYKQNVNEFKSLPGYEAYPAYLALVEIGKPSIEGLLLKIGSSDTNQMYRELTLDIIGRAVGRDQMINAIESFEKEAARHKALTDSPKHDMYKNYNPARVIKFKSEVRTLLSKG